MTIMATSLALWVFVATRQLYLCGMGSQGEFIHTSVIRLIVIMMITSMIIITSVIRPIIIMMITSLVIIPIGTPLAGKIRLVVF